MTLPPLPGAGEPSDQPDAPATPELPPFAPPGGGQPPGGQSTGGQPGPAGAGSATWGSWTAPTPWPPPYATGGPWHASPPSRRRVHLIWLAVSLVSLVLGGFAGFAISKAGPRIGAAIRSAGAAAGVGPCPGATAPPGAGAALSRRLLPVPASAKRYTKGEFARRVLTADQLSGEFWRGDPLGRFRLSARCFRIAAQVNWLAPSGAVTVIWLVQFATANDARSFALMLQAGDIADPSYSVHMVLNGVADGMLIGQPSLDHYGNMRSRLIGDRSNVAIIIHLYTPAHLPRRSTADALLRRQAARI